MSDIEPSTNVDTEVVVSKEELMAEAESLGLKPHHATGTAKLQDMIKAELAKGESAGPALNDAPGGEVVENVKADISEADAKKNAMNRSKFLKKEQMKLIRVVVRCNNDNKKELTGETHTIICAAGTIKKYVPFDNEEGWHVPSCILDVMRIKTCQKFRSGKLPNGTDHRISYTTREYVIEELPQLTKPEIDKLAHEQSSRGSLDN